MEVQGLEDAQRQVALQQQAGGQGGTPHQGQGCGLWQVCVVPAPLNRNQKRPRQIENGGGAWPKVGKSHQVGAWTGWCLGTGGEFKQKMESTKVESVDAVEAHKNHR